MRLPYLQSPPESNVHFSSEKNGHPAREVKGLVKILLIRARPDFVARQQRGFGFPKSRVTVPSWGGPVQLPEDWREVSARERAGPEDMLARKFGRARRGVASMHQARRCAAPDGRAQDARCARLAGASGIRAALVEPVSGSRAPAGGEAGPGGAGSAAVPYPAGWGSCAPRPQDSGGHPAAGSLASGRGGALPRAPDVGTDLESFWTPGLGRPREKPGPSGKRGCGDYSSGPPPGVGGCPGPLGPPR